MHRVIIFDEDDIYKAVTVTKMVARSIPLMGTDETKLIIAVMELARNMFVYAGKGEIIVRGLESKGVEVIAADQGPGIEDIDQAMQEGFTTGEGLGLGLSGVKRLVNEFQITSTKGVGTSVRIVKWADQRGDLNG